MSVKQIAEEIAASVSGGFFARPALETGSAPWDLDMYTLRTAATRYGRCATPLNEAQRAALRAPHAELSAEATLDDLPDAVPADLEIVVLCRPAELDGCVDRAAAWLELGWNATIVVDERASGGRDTCGEHRDHDGRLRIVRMPLDGDFGAQRNFAQTKARRRWVLQLDADETPDEKLVRSLGGLIAMAERDDILSVGFPRRNIVGGMLSDVYPDVQYRLNRATVRFGGRVHERPVLPGGWPQGFIALSGAINHHLSAEHVVERSRRYEALAPGHGRPDEARQLIQPYRP